MIEGQGLNGYIKGLSLKNYQQRTSKIWAFDLEGQDHLWMKVKVSVVY
jgi:hypothetical protein